MKSIQIVPNEIDLGVNSIGEKIKCKLTINNESKSEEAGFVILDSTKQESYQVQFNIKNGTIAPCKHEIIELTCEYFLPGIQTFSVQIQDLKTKIIHKCLIKCRVIVDSPIHIENINQDRILNFGFCYIHPLSSLSTTTTTSNLSELSPTSTTTTSTTILDNLSKVSNFKITNTKDYSLNLKLISNSKKQILIYSDENLQNLLTEKSIIKIEPQQTITIHVGLKPHLNSNLAKKGKCISFSSSIVLNVLNEEKQIFSQVIQIRAFVGKSILNIDNQFIDFGWSSNLKTFNSQFTLSNGNQFLPLEYEIISSSPNELYLNNDSERVGNLIGCKINSSNNNNNSNNNTPINSPIPTSNNTNNISSTNTLSTTTTNNTSSNEDDENNKKVLKFTFNPLTSGLHDHYFTIINKSSSYNNSEVSKIAIRAFVDDRKSLRNNLQADSSGVDALVFSNVYVIKEQDENDQIVKITGIPHQHLQKLANQLVEEYDYLQDSDEELRNEIRNSTILGVQEFQLSNISKNDMILIPNSDIDMIVFVKKQKSKQLSSLNSIEKLERIKQFNSFTQYPNKGKPFILPAGEQLTLVTMLSGLPLTMNDNETENLLKKNYVELQRSLILSDDEQRALKLINVHIQMGISEVSLRSNTINLGKIGYIDKWSDRKFQIVLNNDHSDVLSKVKLISKPKGIEFVSNYSSMSPITPTSSGGGGSTTSTTTMNLLQHFDQSSPTLSTNSPGNSSNSSNNSNEMSSRTKWTIPPKGQKTIICILKTSEFKDFNNFSNNNILIIY
ncbi:predicted protein [Naegleria gruberi]|uniref:Predicted protein n=1 Tax=Naegleria gruberi TaxID=5762 RepID=D2VXB7_NAEGR|nr:uncharacterized protein NAEGRDRAFT_73689 [Naegleria gruberi]EFC38477.1 predicted protein [Naegleria gruberi]|eukprot:XP_002671221.1 predicted protein [Naegleria gruberi strain NEG-M]